MKFDTLDDDCSLSPVYLAMAQMFQKWITVTANNPCRHHSDIYLYVFLSFFSVSPFYDPTSSLFLYWIIKFLPHSKL